MREGFRWHRPWLLHRLRALVGNRFHAVLALGREFFQFRQLEAQLRLIEFLAFPTAKQLLLQPRNLRPQRRVLLPELGHFLVTGRRGTQRLRGFETKSARRFHR